MIKVISFDIGGTLIKNELQNNNYNLKQLSLLLDLQYEIVRKKYKDIFQKQKDTLDNLIMKFCCELNININDSIKNFFYNKFDSNNISGKIDKNDISVIKKLKEMKYVIILFSNSCCIIKNDIDKSLLSNIDKIYYSYDLGYTKSDAESYRFIEKDLGYESHEFLHIGDTLKSDYLYPIKNGWNALYYGDIDNKKVNSITNLSQILKYIKK